MAEDNKSPRIILMGHIGSGKSTFISNIVGQDIGIGHGLDSHTQRVEEIEAYHKGKKVFLVDTPGFDDTNVPDAIILKKIGDWLKKKSLQREAVAGVIYLHRIRDPRLSGPARRNLQKFEYLCKEGHSEYSPRIAVASTHWAEEDTQEYTQCVHHLKQFKENMLKPLIEMGATTFDLKSSPREAENPMDPKAASEILDHILSSKNKAKSKKQSPSCVIV